MEHSEAWKLTESLNVQQGRTDPFSAAIRASRMPMIVTDPNQPDNPIIFANDAFLHLTGYARSEVNGRNCRFLQGPETDPETVLAIRAAIEAGRDIAIDILNYRKDGSTFWNGLYVSPVVNEAGAVQYFFASQIDATERKHHELRSVTLQQDLERQVKVRTRELEEALRTSNMLLHEVDHRVKNNLQMISAMLMLQSLSIPDARIKNTLQEMLERIEALGLVHKRLYLSNNIMDFDLGEFAREIASNLVAASGRRDINLSLDMESVKIKADDAASIALIINEAITNALKHAFPPGKPGDIKVSIRPDPKTCEIAIEDNGVGMGASRAQGSGFGTTLIETLLQQLRATIEWTPASPGTRVRIVLPL